MSRGRVFPTPHPRLATAATALAAGLVLLAAGPRIPRLEQADRELFARLAGMPLEEVEGEGSHADPRRVEALGVPAAPSPPGVLGIGDDPEGYFEAMPPPPADFAVLFSRLRQAGARHLGMAFTADWNAPDPTALHALRTQLDHFDAAVLGFPLAYSGSPRPVAEPFVRRSIPYFKVRGEASRLPVVNSIPLATPELGGEASTAGFTRLVNEPADPGFVPLIARWDDRIVFALPLALEIARSGVADDEVRVIVGEEIQLGRDGARIPIDERGRFRVPGGLPGAVTAPATELFGGTLPEGLVSADAPVYLTDRRADIAAADRAWLERLPVVDLALRRTPRVTGTTELPRPDPLVELVALSVLVLVSAFLVAGRRVRTAFLGGAVLLALVLGVLQLLIHRAAVAPMPLAFSAAAGLVWIGALLLRPQASAGTPGQGSGKTSKKASPEAGSRPGEGEAAGKGDTARGRKAAGGKGRAKSRKRRRR